MPAETRQSSGPAAGPPRAVVFDFGGVLLDWNPRYLYRPLFGDDHAGMEYFLTHICSMTWNLMQDAGRPFAEGVAELSARYPDHRELIAAYHDRWEEMIPGPIHGTVEVVRALHQRGIPLYGLSNFSRETFALTRRRFDFFAAFQGIIISGEVRLIKPDPAIYLRLLHDYQLDAGDCLFIDDLPLNLQTAEHLGLRTLHFQSPARLRDDLTGLGLL
jgi:2-haloacid dehalogenase